MLRLRSVAVLRGEAGAVAGGVCTQARREDPGWQRLDCLEHVLCPITVAERQCRLERLREGDLHRLVCGAIADGHRQRLFCGHECLALLPLRTTNHRFRGAIALSLLESGRGFVPRMESEQVAGFLQSALCHERLRQRTEEGRG